MSHSKNHEFSLIKLLYFNTSAHTLFQMLITEGGEMLQCLKKNVIFKRKLAFHF